MIRFSIALFAVIALTACVPGTESASPAPSRAPYPSALMEPLSPYFVLEASINGGQLSLTPDRGIWLLDTEAYELGLAFRSPDTVRYFTEAMLRQHAEERDDRTYESIVEALVERGGVIPITTSGLTLSLRNSNPQVIRILWEESVFVLVDGSTSRILRAGTRYADRNNPQSNSVIPPGGRVDETMVPVNNVSYEGSFWFDGRLYSTRGARRLPADTRLTLFLVLEIEGERHELTLNLTNPTPIEFLR
jgi:hypothetical protein